MAKAAAEPVASDERAKTRDQTQKMRTEAHAAQCHMHRRIRSFCSRRIGYPSWRSVMGGAVRHGARKLARDSTCRDRALSLGVTNTQKDLTDQFKLL
jgi:hypothetical protein